MENDIQNFDVQTYLSPSQIDIIKSRANSVNRIEIVDLVHGFVESNGTLTPEFVKLENSVRAINESILFSMNMDPNIQKTLSVMLEMGIFNLLILVGVIKQEDMDNLKANMEKAMASGMGFPGLGGGDDKNNNQA